MLNIFAHSKKWLVLTALALSLMLSACATEAAHEWLEAPDWSRARQIGTTEINYPVTPALDSSGNLYFAISQITFSESSLELHSYDADLNLRWQHTLELNKRSRANQTQIAVTNAGVEIFWILENRLYTVRYSTDGALLDEPQAISGVQEVSHYDVGVAEDGSRLLWFSGDLADPGLSFADAAGNITLVDRAGYAVDMVASPDGGMFAVWLRSEPGSGVYEILYGHFPGGHYDQAAEEHVYSITVPVSSAFLGPQLGVDDGRMYVFWIEETRAGPNAGQFQPLYFSIPFEEGELLFERTLTFPADYDLNYSTFQEGLHAGERALPSQQDTFSAPLPFEIFADPVQRDELVIGVKANLPHLFNQQANQTGLIFFDEGFISSYQLLSFTAADSEFSSIQSDDEKYLHATWLEENETGTFRVFYATTSPQTRVALDEVTSQDALRVTGSVLFGLLSDLVLVPFPLVWAMIGAVLILVTGFMRKENEGLGAPTTLISMLVALAGFNLAKVYTLPGLLEYVPFSAWLPVMPRAWEAPLSLATPILIGLLALYMAWRATYRRSNPSALIFFLFYSLVDGVLSIGIYGVLFYNAL